MTMAADFLTGLEALLLAASQVRSEPPSVLARGPSSTLEVTVIPEETSELAERGSPLRYHRMVGLGRPEMWKSET